MKNNLIALVLAALITVIYFACSKVITPDQLQYFTLVFIFGLSFALLFSKKSKIVSNQHQLGHAIDNAVRSVIAKERRQGGLLTNDQKHSCSYSIIHKVGGIHVAKSILGRIPEHIFSMRIVKMTHYDPIFRKYWYVTKCKRNGETECYVEHLGELQTFPNPNPPRLISLISISNAIQEIEKYEQ